MLKILAAVIIIAVLGWQQYLEVEDIEKANRESGGRQIWEYDGGWVIGRVMMLSVGIIALQIYSRIKAEKKAKQ